MLPPPANQASGLMAELIEWLQTTDCHPLISSSIFHYEFEFIHPFADGNGRMGRLWQTLMLSRWKPLFNDMPLESVIKDNQQEYYNALGQADESADSTGFIVFMLQAIFKTIEQTDQVSDQVSDQVKRLLSVLSKQWLSANEIMQKLNLSHRPTFRKNYLNPALELGLIEMNNPDSPRSPNQKYKKVA